jgi:hypothetical protein
MRKHRPLYVFVVGSIVATIAVTVYIASIRVQSDLGAQPEDATGWSVATRPSASAIPSEADFDGAGELPERVGANGVTENPGSQIAVLGTADSADSRSRPTSGRLNDGAELGAADKGESVLEVEPAPNSELPCWQLTSNLTENYYTVDQDTEVVFSGESSARISSISNEAQFGTLSQTVSAAAFAGKRVEFSAFLKFENVSRGVSLWVLATDAAGNITVSQRLNWVPGSFDWHSRSIVVDVPIESVALRYAVNITGEGTLWVDDARIVAVDSLVAVTFPDASPPNGWRGNLASPEARSLPSSSQNTDFEIWDAGENEQRACAAEAP